MHPAEQASGEFFSHFLRFLLRPFSWAYGLVVWLRNAAFDAGLLRVYTPPVPVISVGNLSSGGTGKTPTACWLLETLSARGWRPAYLSRGYGRSTQGFLRVAPAEGDARRFGDEALMLALRFPALPVAVCEDRAEGIRRLANEGADIIVLDDAFQHRRVRRSLDMVLLDSSRPFWQDALLPAGRLREAPGALRRADLLVISRCADIAPHRQRLLRFQKALAAWRSVCEAISPFHSPSQAVTVPPETKALLFCGIGNPKAFERQAMAAGLQVSHTLVFPDHHVYSAQDLERIRAAWEQASLQAPGLWLLTTEKDFARLWQAGAEQLWPELPLYVMRIGIEWTEGLGQVEAALAALKQLS